MLRSRFLAMLVPVVISCSAFGGPLKKAIAPKAGVAILVNEKDSRISIDAIDGEHKGVKSRGVYELKPGKHAIRARLHYRIGRVEWSSNTFVDYPFNAEAGAVLKVVCEETRTTKEDGTWKMWIENTADGRVVDDRAPSISEKELQLIAERNFTETREKAEQGELEAQFDLGLLFERGEGTSPNSEESIKWYLKAAERGHATAQFMLGLCYDSGQGVAQDYAESFVWLSLAAASGDASAPYFRDENEKELSPEALTQAKERIRKLEEEIRARTVAP